MRISDFVRSIPAFRNPQSAIGMHLIIDGYNLLHVNRSLIRLNSTQLQWERDRLIDQLSAYQKLKPCGITVVFDGWQGGWSTRRGRERGGLRSFFPD